MNREELTRIMERAMEQEKKNESIPIWFDLLMICIAIIVVILLEWTR